jgi:hypothetical protein
MAFDPQYGSIPLGSLPGERRLAAPYNAKPVDCVVRVRNLSATKKRTVVEEAISIRRGGDRAIAKGPYSGKEYSGTSVEQLRFRVAQGDDMNWYKEVVKPVDFVVRHGGRQFVIPYARDGEPEPQWVTVDPGAWDLYMGNWERMHSADPREKQNEGMRRQGRGLAKFVAEADNPFGFLEFDRREIKTEDAVIDKQALTLGNMIEV